MAIELIALSILLNALWAFADVEMFTDAKPMLVMSKSFRSAVSELPEPLLKPMKTSNELVAPLNRNWPLNSVTVAIRSISDRSVTNS